MNQLSYSTKSIDEVYKALSSETKGLSSKEAASRLTTYGLNELKAKSISWITILWRQFNTPFIFLLLGATILSFALREISDGVIIFCFIIINGVLGFTQEFHSAQSLELLKKYVAPEARVRRGGVEEHIAAATLVPGDVVLLAAGDSIPADIRFTTTANFLVDETILTGESVPVEKNPVALGHEAKQPSDAKNIGFAGTIVMSGSAEGIVLATGEQTFMGDVSKLTVETHHESTFEKNIGKFSKFILRMIIVILVILFVANIIIKGHSANIFEMLLFSIALAVSVVPEALPVVTTIALSKGAIKMAKNKVVVKRLSAVEDLGSIEVLCTDKTGTLTENKLRVANIFPPSALDAVLLAALAAESFGTKRHDANNSFDIALFDKLTAEEKETAKQYRALASIPFDPDRRRSSVLVEYKGQKQIIVRGAPETIVTLAAGISTTEKKQLEHWMAGEGAIGNRVIAVAVKKTKSTALAVADEKELTLIGLISFVDPIKTTAETALAEAKKLGLSIKILTGDSKEVAGAVGQRVGMIKELSEVITGEELDNLKTLREQFHAAESHSIFARVSPRQKYKIIELLQARYEVGYMGDGINDAPALKIADVGIAVNTAADIAREAADIVLLKKSLGVLVQGIKDGREIFANTVKYIKATLISNFGNFYTIAIAALILPYLPMLPVQVLLLNLLTDFPMIAIATDTVDKDELRRPKSYNVREIILVSIILGCISTIFDFIFFVRFFHSPEKVLQTCWFIGSTLTELAPVFSIRSRGFFLKSRPPALSLWFLCLVAGIVGIVLPFTPFGADAFGFIAPTVMQIGSVIVIVAAYFVVNELIKVMYYRHNKTEE